MSLSERPTIARLAEDLASGRVTSRVLVEQSLARIADPAGEGPRAFIKVRADGARIEADRYDLMWKQGRELPRFAGIPCSVKDLFDVEGEVTTVGSLALRDTPPARADAPAIVRLRSAGFIVIGRTNMTEFAYSGVGLNPHYGTPLSIYDRKTGRIPGGSSSGEAVGVAEGICALGIGSDTGGSCRIPAAFNGIVGYKPSANTVSKEGVFPLSPSFDSIGSMANSISCCASAHAIMAGAVDQELKQVSLRGKRLAVIKTYLLDDLDEAVAKDFDRALQKLSRAGADIVEVAFPELNDMPLVLRNGGIVAYEAYNFHRLQIESSGETYDPRVLSRLKFGAETSEVAYRELLARRAEMISAFAQLVDGYDGVLSPAVAITPPAISALAMEDDYRRLNGICLRNSYVFNFLDGCSGCLPMHAKGEPPTGFMVSHKHGFDHAVLETIKSIESVV